MGEVEESLELLTTEWQESLKVESSHNPGDCDPVQEQLQAETTSSLGREDSLQASKETTSEDGEKEEWGARTDVSYPALSSSHGNTDEDKEQEDDSPASPTKKDPPPQPVCLHESPFGAATPDSKHADSMELECASPDQDFGSASPTINLNALQTSEDRKSIPTVSISFEDIQYPALPDENDPIFEEDQTPQDGESSPDELSMDLESTETLTLNMDTTTTLLEDDKAILRSFLNRAAANKANKSATILRRESLQNRRDSDAIRHALASPRQVLEEKDANLSPQRTPSLPEQPQSLTSVLFSPLAKRSAQDAGLGDSRKLCATDDKAEDELAGMDNQNGSPRRRSTRARTKIPQLPTANSLLANTPNKIPVRTDGGERVLLARGRSEAQLLNDLLVKNTKKNKFGAIPALARLKALKAEALAAIVDGVSLDPIDEDIEKVVPIGIKTVRWKEVLTEFSDSLTMANPDESPDSEEAKRSKIPSSRRKKVDIDAPAESEKKQGKPRLRRLKGLGTANGTPARGLLSSTLLPDEVQEELAEAMETGEASATSALADEKLANSTKKTKIAAQSKLQQPKKLTLNPSLTSLSGLPVLAGKENASQLLSPAKKLSTRGKIPMPPTNAAMGTVVVDAKSVKRSRTTRKC
jgi:hypothetical protein